MIHVLLTSELPLQHNDAITFFICLSISRYFFFFFFFFRNRLRKLVPPLVASAVEKFEQILLERFGNNFKQSFKGHKNSE